MGAYGIPGDPAGMRALAQLVRGEAQQLDFGVGRVSRQLVGMHYEGPAANRFRSDIAQWQFACAGCRTRLEALAALLTHEAARVEALQEQARREHERREREARERAQAAARR